MFGKRVQFSFEETERARISVRRAFTDEAQVHRLAYDATVRMVYVASRNAQYVGPPGTGIWAYVPQVCEGSMFACPPGLTNLTYSEYLQARGEAKTLADFGARVKLDPMLHRYIVKRINGQHCSKNYAHLQLDVLGDEFIRRVQAVCKKNILTRPARKNQPDESEFIRDLRAYSLRCL